MVKKICTYCGRIDKECDCAWEACHLGEKELKEKIKKYQDLLYKLKK